MRRVYVAALTSPEFLFLAGDATPNPAEFTLASRLSYWLWNGPPDAPLIAAARDGSLRRPEILRAQIDRLLADPRAERFVSDFTRQWLDLSRLDETNPDPLLYPEYRFLLGEGVAGAAGARGAGGVDEDIAATQLARSLF